MKPTTADRRLAEARRHLEAKRFATAAAECRALIARTPALAAAHELLGEALEYQGQSAAAEASFREALRLQPDRTESYWGLSCALRNQNEFAAAVPPLRRMVELNADDFVGWHNLGTTLHELGRTDDALDALKRSVQLGGFTAPMSRAAIATIIPGSTRADNAAVLAARRAFAADLPHAPCPAPPGVPDRPVRIGYVSSFFQDRNWMKPVWGVINRHDRERFAVHLFSEGPADAIQHGYRPDPRDHFHDFRGQPNEVVADRIRAAGIDVLVDLNGYSRTTRLPIYAHRPAPVQVAWFNMYATSGVPGLDHLFGDDDVIPPAEEPHYSERITRLPRCYLTYEVTYPVPDVAPPPCVGGGGFTFGCLAPQYKVTPPLLDAWARILQHAPACRLVMKGTFLRRPHNADWLRQEFVARGVPADRVELEGPAEHFTFLQKYAAIDVALDSFPYNGGTTTMESLWQGVPVVCFAGDRWGARIGASMMRSAGLPEFVAADVDGYVNLAVQLANDPATPARLSDLRATMRDRLRASRLCDVPAFIRELEAAYLAAMS